MLVSSSNNPVKVEKEEIDDDDEAVGIVVKLPDNADDVIIENVYNGLSILGYKPVGKSDHYIGHETQYNGPSENKDEYIKTVRNLLHERSQAGLIQYYFIFDDYNNFWKLESAYAKIIKNNMGTPENFFRKKV